MRLSLTTLGGVMLTSRKMTLKPLLESADGIHLTAYLVNRGTLADLRHQLREVMNEADECLNPVLSAEDRIKFLEPLNALLQDSKIFQQISGNIGIFRNHDLFRVLNIPVDVEPTCQVATSFHVKPLLRWLQTDKEFLLLGIDATAAHLFLGSQNSIKRVDSILLPDSFRSPQHQRKKCESFHWLNDWIARLTHDSALKLFVAAEGTFVESLIRSLEYKGAVKSPVANFFATEKASAICTVIRKSLSTESSTVIERALAEFRFAEEGNRTRKNIFQISKAVVQGRVRKLIVSDELNIFGKIDKVSGGLAIHPCDLDHEDDDILDDLAQMVLSQGGEVVIASRNQIPNGRPILAILEDGGDELRRMEDFRQNEILEERYR